METLAPLDAPKRFYLFKSHYVVWKQITMKRENVIGKMFKSHYVVWKQFNPDIPRVFITGLNRTM